MKPPVFWQNPPQNKGIMAQILRPLSAISAQLTARRIHRTARFDPKIPVICVGNLTLGGAGKTPTVIALISMCQALGLTPCVITRGYGGALPGPLRVDPKQHSAEDVGDEPLLIAAFAPVFMGKDRAKAAQMADTSGADIIIMDDGHQNPDVVKDISIVVVDAARGFGNGLCAPAGPLREPVAKGLNRADILLSIGDTDAQEKFAALWQDHIPCPHITGKLSVLQTGMDWAGTPVIAFAGIADPNRFFTTLRGLGTTLLRSIALGDHQPLSISLIARLRKEAQLHGAQLVCTEKDAVRLPSQFRQHVLALPVRLVINTETVLTDRIKALITAGK